MESFMAGALTLDQIYNRLREDFRSDGHEVSPDTDFYDDPPDGMGYDGEQAIQGFLKKFVNGDKKRYNIADDVFIYARHVGPPKNVGNLAALIFAKQK